MDSRRLLPTLSTPSTARSWRNGKLKHFNKLTTHTVVESELGLDRMSDFDEFDLEFDEFVTVPMKRDLNACIYESVLLLNQIGRPLSFKMIPRSTS